MKTKPSVYQLICVPTLTDSHELWVLIKRMRLWSKELLHIKRREVRCFWQLTGTPPGSLLDETFSARPAGGDPGSDPGQAGYLGLERLSVTGEELEEVWSLYLCFQSDTFILFRNWSLFWNTSVIRPRHQNRTFSVSSISLVIYFLVYFLSCICT